MSKTKSESDKITPFDTKSTEKSSLKKKQNDDRVHSESTSVRDSFGSKKISETVSLELLQVKGEPGGPANGILASGKIRIDSFGNKIVRKGKSHKISFNPEVSSTFLVENWKKYNSMSGDSVAGSCTCNIM